MRVFAVFAACVAAASAAFPIEIGTEGEDEPQQCPSGWLMQFADINNVRVARMCYKKYTSRKTWYQAEAYCRTFDAHLASAETQDNADRVKSAASRQQSWFGLRFATGNWEYAGGQDFGMTRAHNMVPTSWDIDENKLCAATDGSIVESLKCSEQLPFICSKPAVNFHYKFLQVSIYGADFGESDPDFNTDTLTRITSDGLVIHSGNELAIGSWISDTKFKADYIGGTRCTWLFNTDDMSNGCLSSGRTRTATWAMEPAYFPPPTEDPASSPAQTRFRGSKKAVGTPKPTYPVDGDGNFYPTLGAVNESKDDKVPTWVWPVAFGGVIVVAVFAAVGGARNKKKKKSPPTSDVEGEGPNSVLNSSEEERSDGGKGSETGSSNTGGGRKKHRSNISPENCETCKKFNEEATRARLYQVHRELANELKVPLQITGIHCDHTGSDHVHIFNVENEFTSYTLGVLSTCYSRVKPRLPKNTRIHIVHKKERQTLEGGADFLGDYDYYGAQYF
eukprot:TRINITY_DN1471_c2_g2_i1.p1 TRINITY_DN1471_c2_g2~~TRINITY_DN1471_c2_g2_i1.p1  ORF type:complete len:506 (+),score=87.71 TRINITY_DN1471_c2_g2_i1:41-1558(+)